MAAPPASVKAAQAQRDKGRKKGDGRPLLSFDEDLGGEGGAGGKKKASGDGSSKPRASLRAPSAAKPAESAAAAPSTQVSAAGAVALLNMPARLHAPACISAIG